MLISYLVTNIAFQFVVLVLFFFKQKTAYELIWGLEFRRVLFRSILMHRRFHGTSSRADPSTTNRGSNASPTRSCTAEIPRAAARGAARDDVNACRVVRGSSGKIGRASCREGGETAVGGRSCETNE